ncbi:MAG: F0F1 ATP synthase subunit A [Candidatus Levybacteria bacterium]|nr:F0F1 ATP synthase subunit A [Candidatus Levybacteria bacterium]
MVGLAPEVITHIGSFPVTNTILNMFLVDAAIIGGIYTLHKNIKKIPGYFQNIFEMIVESFYDLVDGIAGKNTAKIFPWFMSFFLFILLANWSGLIPGIGTIGIKEVHDGHEELVPLIRNLTSDLNATFGLALISLVATHTLAIQTVGIKEYLSRYFSINPVMLFVGLLEIVSEITKIISLSFRLFGNIYAGEVVIHTINNLFAFLLPIPFFLLEVIVGLVQALVFSMLTMVFMSVLMTPHHAEEHAETH